MTSLQLAVAERAHHALVVPCELPDGILLVYADDRGRQHTVDLHDANLVDFGLAKPLRKPPAYRGQRNFPGWWWSATTRSHVLYESWLERHYIIEADRDARVAGISGQPFALTWPSERKRDAAHFPDLFWRSVDGGGIVTDCRPVERSDDEFRYKCSVTAAACQVAGWEFRLSGEPDPVWAANLRGELSAMALGYLLTAPGFQALDAVPPRRVPQDGRLSTLEASEQERVRWLEGHLIELETGRHPERPPRAKYDPVLHGTDEREQAKLAEFEAAGRPMTRRHLQRLRRAYREDGLIGLADRRKLRTVTPGGETDPRVVAVIEKILSEPRGRSTVARSVMFAEIQRRLDDEYGPGAVPLPSRRTLYRLLDDMDRGRRNFASESSRRVSVNRPRRPFTPVTALRPGEDVPIDTNTLDIMCRYADGVIRRAELTMAIDVATRSILAGIIAPTTKAVDAAAVLARMLVPEPMRPGWSESLHHAHSVIPPVHRHQRCLRTLRRLAWRLASSTANLATLSRLSFVTRPPASANCPNRGPAT